MTLRRLGLACLLLALLPVRWPAAASPPLGRFDEPSFVRIGDSRVIPESVVSALAEDAQGQLWIGTASGLISYDGYRFRRYATERGNPESLPANLVRALLGTRDGRLWVGTDVDGIAVREPGSERFRRLQHDPADPHSLGTGTVFSLAEDADGRLWVATRGAGLHRLREDGRSFDHFTRGNGLLSDEVNVLLADSRGRLWIGTSAGLNRIDRGSDRVLSIASSPQSPDSLADEVVYSLHEAADGQLWVGTRDGDLLLIDPRSDRSRRVAGLSAVDAAATASVFAIAHTGPDRIWLARSSGLEIRDREGALLHRMQHDPARPRGVAGNDLRELLVDRAGGLWVAGFGAGLQRHDPTANGIRALHGDGGDGVLGAANVSALLHTAEGEIWVGSRGRGIAVLDRQLRPLREYRPQPEHDGALVAGWITSLAQTRDGRIWIGSRDALHRYDRRSARFEAVSEVPALGAANIRRLQAGSEGQLWVGSSAGTFEIAADGSARRLQLEDAALPGDSNAFAMTPDGTLWLGTTRGLLQRPPGASRLRRITVGEAGNQAAQSIVGLLVDRRGQLWVDSVDGLYRHAPDAADAPWDAVSERLGMAGTSFGANLLDDAQGRIWSMLHVYDPSRDQAYSLTAADGLDIGTPWFRSYAAVGDELLLFGGSEGMAAIAPAQFKPWEYAPPLLLSELKVDGRRMALPVPPAPFELQSGQRGLSLEFAALDYSAPALLRYRHRLHGVDVDWIEGDAESRLASYGGLWPGDYRFEVEASNRAGRWSEQRLQLPIRVLPAYWQTPAFAVLLLSLLLGLIALAIRWRTARSEQHAQRLQRLVDERTAQLSLAKQRAEAALDDLRGTQQQLVAAEKMASLGQLVAGIAHEINTPIGIALTAASHVHDVTREGERKVERGALTRSDFNAWRAAVDEGMRLIMGSLDRAHTLIASFKQVAVDQTSEQRREIVLLRFLDEVRFALQPTLRRGGHQLQIDCPDGVVLDSYPGALFQIITNLINNSILHGYPGGAAGQLQIEARNEDGQVLLIYRDDGVGMDATVAARAFEPFFTTRRGKGGSGLGLHLVYNLATQLLGGRIELHSRPGAGCEFRLRIPRSAPPRAPSAESTRP